MVAGLDTIEYCVIDDPPVAPGVIVIVASAFPADAVKLGACGTVVAVTPDEAEDADDVPILLDAVTVYVYCVLEARPVTDIGEDVPVNVDGEVDGEGVTVKLFTGPPVVAAVNATDA